MPLAFITGGASRLGRALALRFAEKGFDVAITYNTSENAALTLQSAIEAAGRKSRTFKADVRVPQELEDALTSCARDLAFPDVYINNAAIFPERKSLADMSIDDWDDALSTNTRPAFIAAKTLSALGNGGRIINIASLGAMEVWNGRIGYNVSKSALVRLTEVLSREMAPRFSVNCICPGAVYMPDDLSPNDQFLINPQKIPMQRWAGPDDIFEAVYFFATCSTYITGQVLVVDGGYHFAH